MSSAVIDHRGPDFQALGIDQRRILDRARAKQMVAVREAWAAIGWDVDKNRGIAMPIIGATVELMFPTEETRDDRGARLSAVWDALTKPLETPTDALDVHSAHAIKTARGNIAEGESSFIPS